LVEIQGTNLSVQDKKGMQTLTEKVGDNAINRSKMPWTSLAFSRVGSKVLRKVFHTILDLCVSPICVYGILNVY